MKTLLKLFIVSLCIASLFSGCRMLPPSDKPFPVNESLHQAEMTEAVATTETSLPATTEPAVAPAEKKSVTSPGERSVKPRLSYLVSEGELLWAIAKRADIYGDPHLWPLLYQANRDQIKDPRKIYAGQVLTIPRNVSDGERERARNLAKKSNFFSPE